jgi:tetratricopeptide (TPR) repeat protein
MPDKIPIIREIAWISVVPQLLFMALLLAASFAIFAERPTALAMGAGTYLVLSRGLKAILGKHQARGVKLLRADKFDEAIVEFRRSYAFFSAHSWLDRWRYLTLLSSSSYSYRELALCNVAFAQLQMSKVSEALETYRRAVAEFPGCELAHRSIHALEAARTEVQPNSA